MLVIVLPTAIIQTLVLASIGGFDSDGDSLVLVGVLVLGLVGDTLTGAEVAGVRASCSSCLIINQLLAPAACLRIIGADIMGMRVSGGRVGGLRVPAAAAPAVDPILSGL